MDFDVHIVKDNRIVKIYVEDANGYFDEYWARVNELGHLVIENVASGDLRIIDGPNDGTIVLY